MLHKVKINGLRIELGEIGVQLESHGAVQRAEVLLVEKQLVAYVSPAGSDGDANASRLHPTGCIPLPASPCNSLQLGPAAASLRTHCKAALPDYMVPSSVVHVSAWPTNGARCCCCCCLRHHCAAAACIGILCIVLLLLVLCRCCLRRAVLGSEW